MIAMHVVLMGPVCRAGLVLQPVRLLIRRRLTTASAYRRAALPPGRRVGTVWRIQTCRVFVVPIEPCWHRVLLPDAEPPDDALFPAIDGLKIHPFGNALRKTYLCHSRSRLLHRGDAPNHPSSVPKSTTPMRTAILHVPSGSTRDPSQNQASGRLTSSSGAVAQPSGEARIYPEFGLLIMVSSGAAVSAVSAAARALRTCPPSRRCVVTK